MTIPLQITGHPVRTYPQDGDEDYGSGPENWAQDVTDAINAIDPANFAPAAKGVTNGDSHDHNGGDGAQIDHVNLASIGTNSHSQIDSAVSASSSHIGASSGIHGASGAIVGTSDTQSLANKTLLDTTTYIANTTDPTKKLNFDLSLMPSGKKVTFTIPTMTSADKIYTLPSISSTLVGTAASQTLTQKSLDTNTVFFIDLNDNTKLLAFDISGMTTGKEVFLYFPMTQNRSITFPDATCTLMPTDPILLTNAQATELGLKQYLADRSGAANDIAYNGGVKATLSVAANKLDATHGSVDRAVLIPYKMVDGTWRLKLNIYFTIATGASSFGLLIAGIVGKSVGSGQVLTCSDVNAGVAGSAFSQAGGNAIFIATNASTTTVAISGDFELNAKPSWAY